MNKKEYIEKQQEEVNKNYEVFKEQLPEIIDENIGKFVLMKGGKIIEYYSTDEDAMKAGQLVFSDKIFSVQEVKDQKIDLGFYSNYAII